MTAWTVRREQTPSTPIAGPQAWVSLIALALATVATLSLPDTHYPRTPFVLLGLANTLVGFAGFYIHGGRVITFSGALFLANGVFCGVAATLQAVGVPDELSRPLFDVGLAALLTNLAMWAVWNRVARTHNVTIPDGARAVPAGQHRWAALVGVVLLVGGALAAPIPGVDVIARTGTFAAAPILAFAAITAPRTSLRGARLLLSVAAAGGAVVYILVFFTGGSRLLLAGLALTLMLAANFRRPRRAHKVTILVGILPALLIAGLHRIELRDPGADADVATVLLQGRGVASVYAPIVTFADLVERDYDRSPDRFERQHGVTFIEAAAVWVPREVWPDKPKGFGARLTEVLRPGLVSAGHSMAALAHGEWYVNFGWAGLPMFALIGGWLAARMDRWQQTLMERPRWTRRTLLGVTVLALAFAGVADYIWMGLFSFGARIGTSIAVLVAVGILLGSKREASLPQARREAMA